MENNVAQNTYSENATAETELFTFGEQKVITMTRDQISKSSMVLDSNGNTYKTRPVQIWELLDDMENMCRENDLAFDVDNIYVQASGSNAILTQQDRELYDKKNAPIQRWVFNNILTRFNLPHAKDPSGETGSNIAISISYHKKGITISWGLNEHICQNFNILSYDNTLKTFGGDNKLNYDKVKEEIAGWLKKFEDRRAFELDTMDRMKNKVLTGTNDVLDHLVGKLYRKAVQQAYGDKSQAPFSINSMSQLVQEIDTRKERMKENPTVWDIYNFGTSVMKPGMVDVGDLLDVSGMYAQFLLDEFNLN